MKQVFTNDTAVPISRFLPTNVSSSINVAEIPGPLQRISVTVNLVHTFTQDLRLSLVAPNGASVLLVGNEGGSGDNFFDTAFDDEAGVSITQGSAPFQGTFRPEQPLANLVSSPPNGTWTLQIQDQAFFDGGVLNRWSLDLVFESPVPDPDPDPDPDPVPSQFTIEIRFLGGLTESQRAVFKLPLPAGKRLLLAICPVPRSMAKPLTMC